MAGTDAVVNSVSAYVEKGGVTFESVHVHGAETVAREALLTKKAKQPAADGLYKLQGGGRIKIEKGWIVWADPIAIKRSSVAGVVVGLP